MFLSTLEHVLGFNFNPLRQLCSKTSNLSTVKLGYNQTIAVYLENVIEYNSRYITKNVFDYNYKYPSEKSNHLPGTSLKKEQLLE